MNEKINKICIFIFLIFSNVYSTEIISSYKSEQSIALSLLHLKTMLQAENVNAPALAVACDYVTRNCMVDLSQSDVQAMVKELVCLLESVKKSSDFGQEKKQQISVFIRTFLYDCIDLAVKKQKTTRVGAPLCFSELVVSSLEVCGAHVLGDLIVDGQIINECCQGSGPVGPPGPPGPPGPLGAPGPPAVDLTSDNYLYASFFSSSFQPTLTNNSEDTIPVSMVISSGWTELVGSSGVAFECPTDGLYQISYNFSPELAVGGDKLYSVSAWLRIINGGVPVELAGSREILSKLYIGSIDFLSFVTQLSNTFFASLSMGDLVQFRFGNTAPLGISATFVTFPIGSNFDGIIANLVITRIA